MIEALPQYMDAQAKSKKTWVAPRQMVYYGARVVAVDAVRAKELRVSFMAEMPCGAAKVRTCQQLAL